RPDVVAGHLRLRRAVVPGEVLAVDVEHGQSRSGRADPDPVGGVDMDRPHEVVAQAVADAPDAEADAVVARQAVAGGDPQVALPVFVDGVDAVRGQAVEHADLARLRQLRHGRGGQSRRQQEQAQPRTHHPVPHRPAPHRTPLVARSAPAPLDPGASSQRCDAGASFTTPGLRLESVRALLRQFPGNTMPAIRHCSPSRTAALLALCLVAGACSQAPPRAALPADPTASAALEAHPDAATYALDPVHTRVMIAVDHAGFSKAIGTASGTTGTLQLVAGSWDGARVDAEIPLSRLDFGDEGWNRAVTARGLLDSERHPTASFRSI